MQTVRNVPDKDNNLLSYCFVMQQIRKVLKTVNNTWGRITWKGVKGKSNPYLCGVDNSRIFTVNVWDTELRFTWRPISSQDHQSNDCHNLACVGPCVTPHFPRVFMSVGRQMTRGKHSHLHTRGYVPFALFYIESAPYVNLTLTYLYLMHRQLWFTNCAGDIIAMNIKIFAFLYHPVVTDG